MRYHKAVVITGPEAAFLMENNRQKGGRASVVSSAGTWYDVRALSLKELEDFTLDLVRLTLVTESTTRN